MHAAWTASRLHWNVEPGLLELKVNVALVLFVRDGGCAVIVVSGAFVSIVHVWLAGVGSTFQAWSRARTWNVWVAAASPL